MNTRKDKVALSDQRWVPAKLMTLKGVLPVTRITIIPPGQHDDSPIVNSFTAVKCDLLNGRHTRWYGVKGAWIDSHLRCRVSGFNPKFEEIAGWEIPTSEF